VEHLLEVLPLLGVIFFIASSTRVRMSGEATGVRPPRFVYPAGSSKADAGTLSRVAFTSSSTNPPLPPSTLSAQRSGRPSRPARARAAGAPSPPWPRAVAQTGTRPSVVDTHTSAVREPSDSIRARWQG
jgi:hypothetical protein